MSQKIRRFKGPALRISQRSRQFVFFPMPAESATDVLGFSTLHWKEEESIFAGFNRAIVKQHVQAIAAGLSDYETIMPNPIIVYFLHDNFRFKANGDARPPVEVGVAEIFKDGDTSETNPVGFVIDGQHRLEALRRVERESEEEDLTVAIICFHAPAAEDEREEFESFVLTQMETINQARPLADNEKQLVVIRINKVREAMGHKPEVTATLIINDLDRRVGSAVHFSGASKRPPKKSGRHWLGVGVWQKALTEPLQRQGVLSSIFQGDYSETPEKRRRAADVLDLYFRAAAGLFQQQGLWESSPSKQRLYHNVGLHVLFNLIDNVNERAKVFSTLRPGQLTVQTNEQAILRLQKVLKPLTLLDWTVGVPTSDPNDFESLKMAGIQNQKGIPNTLRAAVDQLIKVAADLQCESEPDATFEFLLDVRDTGGVIAARQTLVLSKRKLDELDTLIDQGAFRYQA